MVRKTTKKTLEQNIVVEDAYSLENLEKKIKEKSNLIIQMQNAVQQLQGQIILLEEMKKEKLVKKMQSKG